MLLNLNKSNRQLIKNIFQQLIHRSFIHCSHSIQHHCHIDWGLRMPSAPLTLSLDALTLLQLILTLQCKPLLIDFDMILADSFLFMTWSMSVLICRNHCFTSLHLCSYRCCHSLNFQPEHPSWAGFNMICCNYQLFQFSSFKKSKFFLLQ